MANLLGLLGIVLFFAILIWAVGRRGGARE